MNWFLNNYEKLLKIINLEDIRRRVAPFVIYLIPIFFSKKCKKQMVPPMIMSLCLATQIAYALFIYRPFKPENATNFFSWIALKLAEAAYQAFIGKQPVSRYRFISTFALNFSLVAALTRSTNLSQQTINFFDLVFSQIAAFSLFLNEDSKFNFLLPLVAAFTINILCWLKEFMSLKKNQFLKKKLILNIIGSILAMIALGTQNISTRESYDDYQLFANSLFPISMTIFLIASKKLKHRPNIFKRLFSRCICCKRKKIRDET